MTPPVRALGAAALALALSTACSRAPAVTPDVTIDLRVTPSPPVVGPAALELTLSDRAGRPVHGARVRVQGTMSHPGMVPSLASATESEPGRYRASLPLTMAGDWIFIVEATLADGASVERALSLPAVRPR